MSDNEKNHGDEGEKPTIEISADSPSQESTGMDASESEEIPSRKTSFEESGMSTSGSAVTRRGSQTLTVPTGVKAPRRLSVGGPPDERDELDTDDTLSMLSTSRATSRGNSIWSELDTLEKRRGSDFPAYEGEQDPGQADLSNISQLVADQLRDLVRRFSVRTERFKEQTVQPATPSTDGEDKSAISVTTVESKEPNKERKIRLDSIAPSAVEEDEAEKYLDFKCCKMKRVNIFKKIPKLTDSIEPQSKLYVIWLSLVSLAYLYNATVIPLRAAFRRAYFWDGYVQTTPLSSAVKTITINVTSGCDGNNATTCMMTTELRYYYEAVETDANRIYWWICDYIADFLFLCDLIFVKTRLKFIKDGLLQAGFKETSSNYFKSEEFKLDVACLFPGELLYFIPGVQFSPLCRLARLLKIKTYWEFFDRLDQLAKSGYIIRVLRTLMYMLFLIHVESCGYYAMSAHEGLAINEWVYNGEGFAYCRCMYLATKTATSIGNNPKPTNQKEWAFMTAYWLSGVFVFAMLIGQIRDIFQSAGAAKNNYRNHMDSCLHYMKSLNLPAELQGKVRTWFNYNWDTQKTLNENHLLYHLPAKMRTDMALYVHLQTLSKVSLFQYRVNIIPADALATNVDRASADENDLLVDLPDKLRTDMALYVHLHTLSKVSLFQDCEKNLLYELVTKLKPCTYLPRDYVCMKDADKNLLYDLVTKLKPVLMLPMDYICKKGEVGTEMYIVKQGQVEVVGGENDSIVFATLYEGSVFGEISLLALGGANRRTANVRSKGFSNLFILSKVDFEAAMSDYPEAYKILKKKAKKVLNKNAKVEEKTKMEAEEIIKKEETPKLLKTVVQVVNPESKLHAYIKSGGSTPRPSVNLSIKDEQLEQLQGMQLTLNRDDEEDELLIVETTERVVSPDILDELEKEGRLSKASVASGERVRLRSGRDSVESAVDSIMGSPLEMASKTKPKLHPGAKVHPAPAKVSFENDITKTRPSPRGWKKSSKVAPLAVEDKKCDAIPPENRVTCDVEIHREKTPSVTSPKGVANPAFQDDKENETNL